MLLSLKVVWLKFNVDTVWLLRERDREVKIVFFFPEIWEEEILVNTFSYLL